MRVLGQPGPDLGGAVGGQVVQDDVDVLAGVRVDRAWQEGQEVGAVAGGLCTRRRPRRCPRSARRTGSWCRAGRSRGCVSRSRRRSIGSSGWVRSSAWIWVFSSMLSTTAPPGGSRYNPTMSATFSANAGSRLTLNVPCRCGLNPVVPPQLRHVVMRDVDAFGAVDVGGHLPARPVRQPGLRRWAGTASRARIRARTDGRHLLTAGASCGRSSNPASTFACRTGRSTDPPSVATPPASAAISFFGRCSACHNTIRARVATVAGTSATVQQGTQLGLLVHRQLHPPSQQHRRSTLRKANRITRH